MIHETTIPVAAFTRSADWRDVLVIGGGASGVLFAASLLGRRSDLRVTVIEGRHRLGCGIAYSTQEPDHLLNTRVRQMSADPGDEEHFLRWLRAGPQGEGFGGDSFVSRASYGRYLAGLLRPYAASGRLSCVTAECIALHERPGGVKVTLAGGQVLTGSCAVLATGHVQTRPDPSGLVARAWDETDPPGPGETVLIVGTGLSMVDRVLSLERAGHRGPIVAISRRGLLPRCHAQGTALPTAREDLPLGAPLSRMLGWLRGRARQAEAAGGSWRGALDGIRPWIGLIWQSLSVGQRARFLRHGASWWEVHRHRLPPASAERIAAALASGRLQIRRAAFLSARPGGPQGIRAAIRGHGTGVEETLDVARIVDCRGIRNDPERHASPLIAGLLAEGAARVDPLRIGLDVSAQCALIGADGRESRRIFALGPVSRATFWEITAIPDIRVQAAELALRVAALGAAQTLQTRR
ncbi:FAD/NAD(P)-binding protein [Paenirhodobacter enshiensis]|uniref:FAD/NAD(P)-binding protein n=1 Tax=Paenirhodobacter enshiensis TaxID=1105367 RepID=UPI00068E280E|nr:FAD/NAD(P)-binding protein [Paenirhodobacter enshiensis]